MLRLIALDLDGTLLRTDKTLSAHTRRVLAQYIARGVHVVIASGRAYDSLPREVLALPGLEYAVTSNGVAVCRIPSGERLFYHPLQESCVRALLQLAEESGALFEFFVDGVAYAPADFVAEPMRYGLPAAGVPYIQSTRRPVEDALAFARAHADQLDCLDFIPTSDAERDALYAALRQISGIYITSSVRHLIEISDAAAGKGAALRRLAAYLHIDRAEIAAFGNEENDRDMMEFAGIGVAVANSPAHLREAADFVTESNDADGVAAFLERYAQAHPI